MSPRLRSRAKHYTPPPDFAISNKQPKTPQRSAVIFSKVLAQELKIQIPTSLVQKLTGVHPRSQSRILKSHQPRTLHNQPDSGPDPRGRRKSLTHSDTAAIADYLEDPTTSLTDKERAWEDIAENAGVDLPCTTHFKPPGKRKVSAQTIQRSCAADEDLITAICEEEKELTPEQTKERLDWIEEQLFRRPTPKDWRDVVFCDEFHFGIGPQLTKKIKRRRGKRSRIRPCNVHRKPITTKDTRAKAREKNHLKLLNVFVAIGYNYRRVITYEVPNKVGKMTSDVYIRTILPTIQGDLIRLGLTLCQDKDSAHNSHTTRAWAKKQSLELLTLPGCSPDFSILETLASPLKRRFHSKYCEVEPQALARFQRLFLKEMDMEMVQGLYDKYLHRFEACRIANGQMTKY